METAAYWAALATLVLFPPVLSAWFIIHLWRRLGPATNVLTALALGVIGTVWFAARGRAPTPADA